MEALKEYAELEEQLCRLLSACLKNDHDAAAIILYSVSNTRARYKIIAGLLRNDHEDTYYKPWKRIEKWLGPRDEARNHIVHWGEDERVTVVVTSDPDDDAAPPRVLRNKVLTNNATRWNPPEFFRAYSEADITSETRANRCMKHIVNRYWLSMWGPQQWPWTDIFQQPIAHQSPEEFLQLLNGRGIPAQL
jgi:hypothetical protein